MNKTIDANQATAFIAMQAKKIDALRFSSEYAVRQIDQGHDIKLVRKTLAEAIHKAR